MSSRWSLCLVLLCLGAPSARADQSLTLSRVIELARTRAPEPAIARARAEEARATLVSARRLATRNPVVEVELGPRWSDGGSAGGSGGRSTDAQVALSVPFDLGGRRAKRVAVAEAEIERERLDAWDVERLTLAAAVAAYYQGLHAEKRLALAEESTRQAEAAEVTARQRVKAGDVAEFEVNLARGEVARARSAGISAQAEVVRQRARLAAVLGLPGVTVQGELADRRSLETFAAAPDRPDARSDDRPDLRALAQEVELARAEAAVAVAERWPSLDLRVTYVHERDADLVLGGISIALPLFERGQGDAARARARGKRAELELSTRARLLAAQVDGARATYAAAVAAVEILAQEAVPLSVENEAAATASYRAGKIELGTLLVIRREVLDTRREHLDRLLDTALAAVDLWIARGAPSLP